MKVAIYTRVSTESQDGLNQELQLRRYCETKDWFIYEIYSDVISGKETKRPAFDKLFADAHKRLFDAVLFWDLSRFSRAGVEHTMKKLKELENLSIDWHSYQEQYISTLGQFKDIVISIMATLAKIEREKISERTKAGIERARSQGKRLGRREKRFTDNDKKDILVEFEKQGTINRTAKVLKGRFGYTYIYNFLVSEGKIVPVKKK